MSFEKCELQFSSVQSLSRVWLFATPWIAAREASLFITYSQSSLRLMSIESVMPSSHLILCCPLFFLPPPASESFPMSQLFAWGGQSTGVSALASFLAKKCELRTCKLFMMFKILIKNIQFNIFVATLCRKRTSK